MVSKLLIFFDQLEADYALNNKVTKEDPSFSSTTFIDAQKKKAKDALAKDEKITSW